MSETEISKAGEGAEQVSLLYDCDLPQRVLFYTERKGKKYRVAHIFRADAVKDEAILEYDRAKNQRLTDADVNEADEEATAVSSQGYKAALAFWEKHCETTEGYAGRVGEKDKAYAVGLLLSSEFEELPVALSDEACPEEDDESSTHRMFCLSDGRKILTIHELRPASTNEVSECQSLLSRTLLVQGTQYGQRDQRVPAKAKRWGELYDLMKVSASGYKRKVPLHHKMVVAIRHLKSEQKAITGNSDASES